MLWDTALIYVVRIRRAGITKLTLQQLWIHWACHDPYGNFPPRSLPIVLPVKWEFVSWFRNTFSSTSQSHSRVQQYSKKAFCVPPVFQYNSSNHSKTSLPMPCFVFYFPISSKWFHPILKTQQRFPPLIIIGLIGTFDEVCRQSMSIICVSLGFVNYLVFAEGWKPGTVNKSSLVMLFLKQAKPLHGFWVFMNLLPIRKQS